MPFAEAEPSAAAGPRPGTTFYTNRPVRRWLRLFVFFSLVMLLTGHTIRETLPFPMVRPSGVAT